MNREVDTIREKDKNQVQYPDKYHIFVEFTVNLHYNREKHQTGGQMNEYLRSDQDHERRDGR